MKVAILSVADTRHMTPSSAYERYFKENGIEYDLICSNKYSDVDNNKNHYRYSWTKTKRINRLYKLYNYLRFYRFAKRIIKLNKYDFIVVWNENTAALFSHFLRHKYKNRYCVNIRDTVADIGRASSLSWKAINNARFCTKPWVRDVEEYPPETYILLNEDRKVLDKCEIRTSFNDFRTNPINLCYMGLGRIGLKTFKNILLAFKNDSRFNLFFYGFECDTLVKDFVDNNQIKNCFCYGSFPPEETAMILNKTDVIMNYYNTGGSQLKFTIGVKASYGPFIQVPQIVDDDTYWAEVCTKYGFGLPVKNENELPDVLYNWLIGLDFVKFSEGCRKYRDFVRETNDRFYSMCKEVFK